MGTWMWAVLAGVAGFLLPFQAGANTRLGKAMPDPLYAAVINFVIGMVALGLLALRSGVPRPAGASAVPWWAWTGGLIGALYVGSAIYVAPRLGATALFAAVLVGQAAGSVLVDHYGLVGFAAKAATPGRMAGVLLVSVGAWLVMRK